jgi:nitroreductase
METLQIILSRRSIRKYLNEPIHEELVEKLLRCAMAAPSAENEQPWHFIVIQDKSTLEKIPSIHPNASMVKDAPMAILICGDLEKEIYEGFWVQDCSAATQNLLLAAHYLGLGAVWLGIHPIIERVEGMRKLLNIPETVIPLSLISLGYPAEKKEPKDRYQPERVHINQWD